MCIFYFLKYYERLAARVETQRDEAEEERIRELTKKLENEKKKALEEQWEECERIKKEAIEEACIALTKKLRNEFVLEKEKAVAEALKIQKVSNNLFTLCHFRCASQSISLWTVQHFSLYQNFSQAAIVLILSERFDFNQTAC